MKKLIIALVAMFMMTVNADAQRFDNQNKFYFEGICSYLELTANQITPVKTAMRQFDNSMEAYYQLKDASKGAEAWEKIQARHKLTMRNILSERQYAKYIRIFDLTVKNTAERVMIEATATR